LQKNIPEHVLVVWNSFIDLPKGNVPDQLDEVSNNFLEIIDYCGDVGIRYLTIHIFQNIPEQKILEYSRLMAEIVDEVLVRNIKTFASDNVCVSINGDFQEFSVELVEKVNSIIEETKINSGLLLNFLINYSGKREINRAISMILRKNLRQSDVDEALFRSHLLFPTLPDPDLEIITGGDYRVQDSLIWQSTYAEMCVSKIPWFAYQISNFKDAIDDYTNTERRFGVLPNHK
jgi:undecaprenyl diphosphate synthase